MFSAFERMVAWRYLRSRRQEGFVSVIAGFSLTGIALGVATLIIVMSVMNGFRAELMGRILGLNGHLGVYARAGPLLDYDDLAGRIAKLPGVTRTAAIIEGQAMATSKGTAYGTLVRGMKPDDLRQQPTVADNILAGSLADFKGTNAIAIGTGLARRFRLRPGGTITLIAPQSKVTAFGSVPRMKRFRVAAIYKIGMYEYDNSFVFMPLDAARIFFKTGKGVTNIEVLLESADDVDRARTQIKQAAGETRLRLVDWRQANKSFFNALKVERNVMFLILTLIILVAVFNVIAGMIMMVKDKGRDIAILRTMGATRGMVMRIFFLTGASVGIVGTAAGLALGLAFAENIETIRRWLEGLTGTELFAAEIYFLSQLPARVDTMEVALVTGMALVLSFLATLYPAWRAARLDPVEALRYE